MPVPERHREGISLVTLAIASAASASAAFVVSRAWGTGTLIGAAATPIIVAVVTELLRRPTGRLRPAAEEPGRAPPARREPPVHVYRTAPGGREWRTVALTALVAFVIGVGLYVVLDRLAGGEGRLVPEREARPPAQTVTTESRTVTVVTQQRTVAVTTVVAPATRTVTVTATAPRRTATAPVTQTTGTVPPEDGDVP